MLFEVDEKVVYPLQDAATISEVQTRTQALESGDAIKTSEVARDLWRRDKDRGLSAGDMSMLAKARQILVSEIDLVEKTNEDKTSTVRDEVPASSGSATSPSGDVQDS